MFLGRDANQTLHEFNRFVLNFMHNIFYNSHDILFVILLIVSKNLHKKVLLVQTQHEAPREKAKDLFWVIAAVLWIRNDLFMIRIRNQLWIFLVPDPDPGKSSVSMRIRIHNTE